MGIRTLVGKEYVPAWRFMKLMESDKSKRLQIKSLKARYATREQSLKTLNQEIEAMKTKHETEINKITKERDRAIGIAAALRMKGGIQ